MIDVDFALRVSRQGSGIMIEVRFNKDRTRAWPSFDSLVEGLPVTVNEWLEDGFSSQRMLPRSHRPWSFRRDRQRESRVSVKSILSDIKSGVADSELMEKFGLSHRGLLSLISKLLWDGLLTPAELAQRKSLARTVFMPVLPMSAVQGNPIRESVAMSSLRRPHEGSQQEKLRRRRSLVLCGESSVTDSRRARLLRRGCHCERDSSWQSREDHKTAPYLCQRVIITRLPKLGCTFWLDINRVK